MKNRNCFEEMFYWSLNIQNCLRSINIEGQENINILTFTSSSPKFEFNSDFIPLLVGFIDICMLNFCICSGSLCSCQETVKEKGTTNT